MKPLIDPQELARRNNEAAAAHRGGVALRRARQRLRQKSPRAEKILATLDRLESKRTARPTRAVGFFLPQKL